MLLIGGFTIASALSKTAIDRVLITRVLSVAGERPSTVLLAFMGVACFASMWISNVAAPTLCFTLIQVRASRDSRQMLNDRDLPLLVAAHTENPPAKIVVCTMLDRESSGWL